MNVQDLAEYLSRASEENPLLEAESPASLQKAYAQLQPGRQLAGRRAPGRHLFSTRTDRTEQGAADRETESLAAFLRTAGAAALGKTPIGVVYIPGRAGG